MSSRGPRGKKTTTPRTPKAATRGRGSAKKTPTATSRAPRSTPKKNVTDLCLEILRKLKATPSSSCTSPLPGSLTQEEKHEWIQTYINSITPNRVDYKKSPTEAIITRLPRNSILDVKEDPKLKQLMEKFREPYAKIVERIDYEKENTEGDGEPETPQVNHDTITEETEPTHEINEIVPSMTYEEFLKKQEEEPSTSNDNFENPTPGTSKQADGDAVEEVPVEDTSQNSSLPADAFVTIRTPLRKRQTDVIEIGEDSDLDDSVEIVKVIPPKRRRAIRFEKEPEVIELDESMEKEPEAARDGGGEEPDRGLGECPICFEALGPRKGITATHCGHIYCTPCIRSSLKEKKACPKCRKHLNYKKIHPLYL